MYVIGKNDSLIDIPSSHSSIDQVVTVRAGKFRRYHGKGLRQLLDIPTLLKNIRDFFYVVAGVWQSYRLIGKLKPAAVFIKGGFVGVPVGLAAAMRRVPFVTHDSDTVPGLANRIIARWAALHAVAMPVKYYPYPKDKTIQVGLPIDSRFAQYSSTQKDRYREQLHVPKSALAICITGGGLGAQPINEAIVKVAPQLMEAYPELHIFHIAGRKHEDGVKSGYEQVLTPDQLKRVEIKGFIKDLYVYNGAADVIVCRAGASGLAEFAAQHKACVVIPNPFLTGGHQLKNAEVLRDQKAAVILDDAGLREDPFVLERALQGLLSSPAQRKELETAIGHLADVKADTTLAETILKLANA